MVIGIIGGTRYNTHRCFLVLVYLEIMLFSLAVDSAHHHINWSTKTNNES